ncbi:MAG: hypothetical protein ACW99G_20435 [Candidatus Thorarchaeota archaeon]|jgi:hypothetical protein
MKTIRNLSQQMLTIPFRTLKGIKSVSIRPEETVEVLTYWKSKVLENLRSRKMVKVVVLSEDIKPKAPLKPVIVVEEKPEPKPEIYAPPKRNNKWRQ